MRSVLENRKDDPVRAELVSFIHDLNEDEQIDLVALSWLGRGDGVSKIGMSSTLKLREPTTGEPPRICWECPCCPTI